MAKRHEQDYASTVEMGSDRGITGKWRGKPVWWAVAIIVADLLAAVLLGWAIFG